MTAEPAMMMAEIGIFVKPKRISLHRTLLSWAGPGILHSADFYSGQGKLGDKKPINYGLGGP